LRRDQFGKVRDDVADRQMDPAFVANPANLIHLGRALVASGKGEQALELVNQALALAPDDQALREAAGAVLTHQVPQFHRSILADSERNEAYARAIASTLKGGERVLDVGTGSGLLAMMASDAGAAEVVACEGNPLLAATASDIVAANGFDDLRIIAKYSTEIGVNEIGGPVDVIIHEIFGDDLLEEGVLTALPDAVTRLGKPGVKAVPAQASIRVALAEFTRTGDFSGFVGPYDLGLFARHIPPFKLPIGSQHLHLRSDPRDLVEFDFAAPPSQSGRVSLTVNSTGGTVNGVVQWLCIRFDEDNRYENRPGTGASSSWLVVFHPFDAVETDENDPFEVHGLYDRSVLCIWGAPI
jgi:hypothetical protein